MTPDTPTPVTELHLATATGVWLIGSTSQTQYYVDPDRRRLLRQPGAGSSTGPFDGVWVDLVSVETLGGERGVIRVGERHRYLTDPDRDAGEHRWWIQRAATDIEPVPAEGVPAGREADPYEDARGYGRSG